MSNKQRQRRVSRLVSKASPSRHPIVCPASASVSGVSFGCVAIALTLHSLSTFPNMVTLRDRFFFWNMVTLRDIREQVSTSPLLLQRLLASGRVDCHSPRGSA